MQQRQFRILAESLLGLDGEAYAALFRRLPQDYALFARAERDLHTAVCSLEAVVEFQRELASQLNVDEEDPVGEKVTT